LDEKIYKKDIVFYSNHCDCCSAAFSFRMDALFFIQDSGRHRGMAAKVDIQSDIAKLQTGF
jgi:hypothetical protein